MTADFLDNRDTGTREVWRREGIFIKDYNPYLVKEIRIKGFYCLKTNKL